MGVIVVEMASTLISQSQPDGVPAHADANAVASAFACAVIEPSMKEQKPAFFEEMQDLSISMTARATALAIAFTNVWALASVDSPSLLQVTAPARATASKPLLLEEGKFWPLLSLGIERSIPHPPHMRSHCSKPPNFDHTETWSTGLLRAGCLHMQVHSCVSLNSYLL
jgi:hypothetical protein